MDCCETKEESNENKKGGNFKMDRRLILWAVIGILTLAVLYVSFKAGDTSSSIQSAGAVKSVAQSAASSGMVGGC